MLKSIRLLNWRSHKDTFLEFGRGTNIIIGIMGAGKSSILEAISFALFVTFPALERRKMKLEDIPRLNEERALVALVIQWKNSSIRVERIVLRSKKGASTEAKVFVDDKLVDSGPKAVTVCIERLLGIDYDLFTRAVYSEQNNIDYFLILGPAERKQEIDALLGLDKFENARVNTISALNHFKAMRKLLEEKFDGVNYEEVNRRLSNTSEELSAVQAEETTHVNNVERYKILLDNCKAKLREIITRKEKYEHLSKELLKIERTIESLNKELDGKTIQEAEYQKEKEQLSLAQNHYAELLKKTREHESSYIMAVKTIGSIEMQLSTLQAEEKRLQEHSKSLESILNGNSTVSFAELQKNTEKELLDLHFSHNASLSEENELKKALDSLLPGTSKCPVCDSVLDHAAIGNLRKEKQSRLTAVEAKKVQLLSLSREKQNLLDTITGDMKKVKLHQEKIDSSKEAMAAKPAVLDKKESATKEVVAATAIKERLHAEAEELRELLNKFTLSINTAERVLRLQKELVSLLARKSTVKHSISELAHDEKSYEMARIASEEAIVLYEKAYTALAVIHEKQRNLRNVQALLKKEKEQFENTKNQIGYLTKLEEELSMYKNALLDVQTMLRANLIDAINNAMNEIWKIFYPYRNYSSLRLSATDRDYVFEVYDGSQWKNLESIASGGERACTALTMRVAMAMVLAPNLSWLVLDEPTHNLDKEAVSLLSETMQNKVPEVITQSIIITHEEALMGSEFAKSYRLVRDKDNAGATYAENI